MSSNAACCAAEQRGFTLIELLVVMMIIGVLAAIAIPSFLGQKDKAEDAAAKSQARTAQTAIETVASDNNGDYSSGNVARLQAVEPTLTDASSATFSEPAAPGPSSYSIVSTANKTGDSFTITRSGSAVTRTCSAGTGLGSPGGCVSGTW